MHDPRVVHENVDWPEGRGHLLDEATDAGFLAHVAARREHAVPARIQRGLDPPRSLLVLEEAEAHGGAPRGEGLDDGAADAA